MRPGVLLCDAKSIRENSLGRMGRAAFCVRVIVRLASGRAFLRPGVGGPWSVTREQSGDQACSLDHCARMPFARLRENFVDIAPPPRMIVSDWYLTPRKLIAAPCRGGRILQGSLVQRV